jgi:RNA polymerase-binding transcription factor DksA
LSADFEEQATEREDDESLAQQQALLATEIAAVKAALARIDEGSYGECVRCGNPVDDKRLVAFPEAALCIDCAREVEAH